MHGYHGSCDVTCAEASMLVLQQLLVVVLLAVTCLLHARDLQAIVSLPAALACCCTVH